MDFKEAKNILDNKKSGNKDSKKIDNNTYLERHEDMIAIRLHNTNIIEFKDNGDIILNSGGWKTPTTKDRFNKFLPSPYGIIQEKGIWYVSIKEGYSKDLIFSDGMRINKKTKPMKKNIFDVKQKIQKRNIDKMNKYCDRFIDEFINGNVNSPSGSDCWYCSIMYGQKNDTNDHYKQHVQDMYFVPSLLANAVKECGSIYEQSIVYDIWYGNDKPTIRVPKDMLKRTLKKFLKKKMM